MYVVQTHEACLHPCSEAQETQVTDNSNDIAGAESAHHEDSFCGLHALSIVDSFPLCTLSFSSSSISPIYKRQFVPQAVVDRPERPKWIASA
ncbi:MAG TPA: hypothetical protein VNT00_09990 [Eoetvoesiella sp.]|uniref:hypothetical protein n=1 Tax=Eoetvoesiella sp. TaxID=1966355 RepID=UPI002B544443|nr:hypothetical protein [Eoetvoesiella sp.]HWK61739.1 hypothetical protein [Eoetvoesiella sp.]